MRRAWLRAQLVLLPCLAPHFLALAALADDQSVEPYIDSIRNSLPPETPRDQGTPDPYIQSIRKQLPPETAPSNPNGDYIERLKQEQKEKEGSSEGYTERLKNGMPAQPEGGAIQAVNQGDSGLTMKRPGQITGAFGLEMGAGWSRTITANANVSGAPFSSVYSSAWTPDINVFYEWQPWHSEWFGNISLYGSFGFGYATGTGVFAIQVPNAGAGGALFPPTSHTSFQFVDVPLTAAAKYSFNLFRVLRPFVMAGPTVIGFIETRNDNVGGHHGYSKAFLAAAGVNVLLDWLGGSNTWDLYAENGVKHYYLTVQYTQINTFDSDVSFTYSGPVAGFTFEF